MSKTNQKNPSIEFLEKFFEDYNHSGDEIRLNCCQKVVDHGKFVKVQLSFLKSKNTRDKKKPYYYRLLNYYKSIKNIQNEKPSN